MRKMSLLFLVFVCILGCANNSSNEINENVIVEWEIKGFNWARSITLDSEYIFEDNIVVVLKDKASFVINFYSFEGGLVKSITLKNGKGPGEVINPCTLSIQNECLYVFDNTTNKITLYDMNGKYIDDFAFNEFQGYFPMIVAYKDNIYLSGIYAESILTRYDSQMTLENHIPNSIHTGDLKTGDKADVGTFVINPATDELFFAMRNIPYEINRYDLNFNKTGTFKNDLTHEYNEYSFEGRYFGGDQIIGNMRMFKNFLYTAVGYRKKSPKKPFFINIIDTDKNKLVYHIICPELTQYPDTSMFRLITVKKDKIYLLIIYIDQETKTDHMEIVSIRNPV